MEVTPNEDQPPDDETTSWTNPYIAEFRQREGLLKATRGYELAQQVRLLNVASYAFGKNSLDLQAHIERYPMVPHTAPPDPDVGHPYTVELSRLLLNALAATSSLISGQRAILRDVWPKIGRDLSDFETGQYTHKRLELFVEIEARLLVDLRNYSQHRFLPRLDATEIWSSEVPLGELKFVLDVDPLLAWHGLSAPVREYLLAASDSIDLLPIIGRYISATREFYKWFWQRVEEKMRVERAELAKHGAELNAFAEEVFLTPEWLRGPPGTPPSGWDAARWRRQSKGAIRQKRAAIGHTSLRGIAVDRDGEASIGDHPWTPITTRVP